MRDASAAALRQGLETSRWSPTDLWRAALGIGGAFSTAKVEGLASGLQGATEVEHDILAAALNEHLSDVGLDPLVPYWAELAPRL
jgi:hypothetical protein